MLGLPQERAECWCGDWWVECRGERANPIRRLNRRAQYLQRYRETTRVCSRKTDHPIPLRSRILECSRACRVARGSYPPPLPQNRTCGPHIRLFGTSESVELIRLFRRQPCGSQLWLQPRAGRSLLGGTGAPSAFLHKNASCESDQDYSLLSGGIMSLSDTRVPIGPSAFDCLFAP